MLFKFIIIIYKNNICIIIDIFIFNINIVIYFIKAINTIFTNSFFIINKFIHIIIFIITN